MNSPYTKAEAKIHILYLVDKVPGVSYHMLMDSCMQSLYVDFFDFSEAYEELISGNLMSKSAAQPGAEDTVGTTEILNITEGGRAVLNDLIGAINDKLHSVLDSIAADLQKNRDESGRVSAYKAISEGSYEVVLKANDETVTAEIRIKCKTEEEADSLIRNWRSNSSAVLDSITDQLSNS